MYDATVKIYSDMYPLSVLCEWWWWWSKKNIHTCTWLTIWRQHYPHSCSVKEATSIEEYSLNSLNIQFTFSICLKKEAYSVSHKWCYIALRMKFLKFSSSQKRIETARWKAAILLQLDNQLWQIFWLEIL